MKTCFLLAFFCCSFICCFANEKEHPDSLLAHKEYFALRNYLTAHSSGLKEDKQWYYHSFLDNFFNRLDESNQHIDRLLEKYSASLGTPEIVALLKLKIDNLVKGYRYKEAYATSSRLLKEYGTSLSAEDQEDIPNEAIIWESLQNIQPQQVAVSTDTRIPYKRDMAGLINVPVSIGDTANAFVFDTGANISVITESNAMRNGLTLMDKYFDVMAATGIKVKARTAVVKKMKIGEHIEVFNAVFMVFPDSTLTFGPYKIHGIIGFPVIEQMGEVRISPDHLEVPREPVPASFANFGLDQLTPVINTKVKTDSLSFTFDTGAAATELNPPYYRKYENEVRSAGTLQEKRFGSAGGTRTIGSYILPDVPMEIAGKTFRLKGTPVKTISVNDSDQYYYGNLGQDIMRQYREMVINFRYMYVTFKD
jgi:predicted aspartyl protease